jgi:AcrR family transcriptional regulator
MGRPRKDAFDEDTTVRVLRAAEQVFGERGFADGRLEDIAAHAGIRRSSLLYHFGSKEKLYLRVVERAFSEIAAAMARGMGRGNNFREKIDGTVDELLEFQQRHQSLMAVVFRAMLDPQSAAHTSIGERFELIIDQLERVVLDAGAGELPAELPVRAILMQLIVTPLAHASMGELGDKLWRGDTHTRAITRMLLLTPTQ